MEETAGGVAKLRVRRYGDLTAVVPDCEHNLCDMARTLRMGENASRRSCNFKELRVVKGHILQLVRYVPDGSLCTASAEQIFPRDSVQRNCFELALYHDCISNRIGSGIQNCAPNTVGARSRDHHAEPSSVLGICFWPFIVGQHAPIVRPWPCRSPQRPTARAV